MKKKILVVGSLNMDMVVDVQHIPVVGETIMGRNLNYIPGGKGANQAFSAGKLGGDVAMLGAVGEDEAGDKLILSLASAGVDTSRIRRAKELPTGTAIITVNDKGNNSIVVIGSANESCTVEYIRENEDLLEASDYIMLQMEIPLETIHYVISRAHDLGKTVILNPAPAPAEIAGEILMKIDFLTPNETELQILTGEHADTLQGIEAGAAKLLRQGVRNVLVTLGERGAGHLEDNRLSVVPTRKVDAVDTTAAGDCFNGAFVVALAEGKTLEQAVAFAIAASSIAVTRKGAQTSIPEREEVEARLAERFSVPEN
ncbi:MAG TPA: ribokinase [Clostridiaceae bacterium]|nr:ribokinase [Clostridiaceae bacterium]